MEPLLIAITWTNALVMTVFAGSKLIHWHQVAGTLWRPRYVPRPLVPFILAFIIGTEALISVVLVFRFLPPPVFVLFYFITAMALNAYGVASIRAIGTCGCFFSPEAPSAKTPYLKFIGRNLIIFVPSAVAYLLLAAS